MNGSECVQLVAEEILKGQVLGLGDPLSYSGISLVPIVRLDDEKHLLKLVSIARVTDTIPKVIIGSLPRNSCGIFMLDSLGDVLAFRLYQDVKSFWNKIEFVERLILKHYRDTRKPLNIANVSSIVVAFLIRLKLKGPKGIMNSESDYFAVSRTDLAEPHEDIRLLSTTIAVLYCAASQ